MSTTNLSYYVASSSNMTMHNENGFTKCKKKIRINNNGKRDKYTMESITNKNGQILVKEEGNQELEKQIDTNINIRNEWKRLTPIFRQGWVSSLSTEMFNDKIKEINKDIIKPVESNDLNEKNNLIEN